MSARKFPRDVPRAVQHAVRVAFDLADDKGEVRGGMVALQAALEYDSAGTFRRLIAEGERWGFFRRLGPLGPGRRLFVVETRLKRSGLCAMPGCDKPKAEIGQWCPACRQAARVDRQWQPRAVEMLVAGKTLYEISALLTRPLFPVDGDPGLIAFFLGEEPGIAELVSREWREALRERAPHILDGGRLTARRRVKKQRAAERESTHDRPQTA
ncbi:MAG: hypothetical protein ACK52I_01720 [Pseudomonadota bacterium]|jgi:hypothetical protein